MWQFAKMAIGNANPGSNKRFLSCLIKIDKLLSMKMEFSPSFLSKSADFLSKKLKTVKFDT